MFNDLTTMRPSPTNQAWADLGDLTAVVRALAQLSRCLPAALEQTADALAHPGTCLGVAGGADVTAVRAELAAALADAGATAAALHDLLALAGDLARQLRVASPPRRLDDAGEE